MKVNKICSSLIKPVTPTPPNLKNYQISFLDSSQLPFNLTIVLYYESKPESEYESDRHLKLEETLAETLVQFYPLAGRFIKKLNSVDCSDQGAEFIQAEAPDVDLASIIGADHHNLLIPDHFFRFGDSADQPLLSIQATRFACGGTALAVSVAHRVFDVSSLETFVAAWSSTARRGGTVITTPLFNLPSLFPVNHHDSNATFVPPNDNVAVKKFDFDKATILSLKSKIGKPVSAGRAASAAMAKALLLLDGAKRGGRCRPFYLIIAVNMREKTTPPVGKHACGNFSISSASRRVEAPEAEGISIPELSGLIGETIRRCIVDLAGITSADGDGRDIILRNRDKMWGAIRDPDTNIIFLQDLSKFGFYEVDVGWGKPAWASTVPYQFRQNTAMLISNDEGDEIEAWLRLNPSDDFHQDCEFINQVISDLSN